MTMHMDNVSLQYAQFRMNCFDHNSTIGAIILRYNLNAISIDVFELNLNDRLVMCVAGITLTTTSRTAERRTGHYVACAVARRVIRVTRHTASSTPLYRGACHILATATTTGPASTDDSSGTASSARLLPTRNRWVNRSVLEQCLVSFFRLGFLFIFD